MMFPERQIMDTVQAGLFEACQGLHLEISQPLKLILP